MARQIKVYDAPNSSSGVSGVLTEAESEFLPSISMTDGVGEGSEPLLAGPGDGERESDVRSHLAERTTW